MTHKCAGMAYSNRCAGTAYMPGVLRAADSSDDMGAKHSDVPYMDRWLPRCIIIIIIIIRYRVWIDGSLAAFASGRHAVGVGDGSFDIEAAAPVSVGSAPDADGDGFEGVATALKVWRVVLSPLQASTPSLSHPRPLVSKPRSLSRGEPLAPLALAL